MLARRFQRELWDGPWSTKHFTHPVSWEWLSDLRPNAFVLDYGCGYGRLVAEFSDRGYRNVEGVDPSTALVQRGLADRPDLGLSVMTDPPRVPGLESPADLVILFAVLTCVPADVDQIALMQAVWDATAPGGLIYVSDLLIDREDAERYDGGTPQGLPYGTFETAEGGWLRHHTADHLRGVTGGDVVQQAVIPVRTMNGRTATGIQILARKPIDAVPAGPHGTVPIAGNG